MLRAEMLEDASVDVLGAHPPIEAAPFLFLANSNSGLERRGEGVTSAFTRIPPWQTRDRHDERGSVALSSRAATDTAFAKTGSSNESWPGCIMILSHPCWGWSRARDEFVRSLEASRPTAKDPCAEESAGWERFPSASAEHDGTSDAIINGSRMSPTRRRPWPLYPDIPAYSVASRSSRSREALDNGRRG